MKQLSVYTIAEAPHDQTLHGGYMSRMAIRGEHVLAMIASLTPFEKMPPAHCHPYDQVVMVLEGTLMEVVEGVEYELSAGKAMLVPAGAAHTGSARGDGPAKLLELFAPARKDYVPLTRYQTEVFQNAEGVDWFGAPEEEKAFTETLVDRAQPLTKDAEKERLSVYTLAETPHDRTLHGGKMSRTAIRGEHVLAMIASLTPFDKMPPAHRHPYDQVVIVLEGTLMEVVEGVEYELSAGKAMVVPAGALHTGNARGDTDAKLVELFAPVRKDYVYLTAYQKETFQNAEGMEWFYEPEEEKAFTETLVGRQQVVSEK